MNFERVANGYGFRDVETRRAIFTRKTRQSGNHPSPYRAASSTLAALAFFDSPARAMIHCLYTRLADPASLVPHPQNPNKHPDAQIALLAHIIRQVGWRHPIVVSKRSGYIVSGHGRLAAALLLGCDECPVSDQDFESEAVENAVVLSDNRIAELAMVDEGELKQMLADLRLEEDFDMTLTGFSEHEIEALLAGIDHLPEEPEKDKTEDSAAWLKLSKGIGGKAVKLDLTNDERDDFAACIREYAKVNGSSSGFLNYVVGVLGKKENQITA